MIRDQYHRREVEHLGGGEGTVLIDDWLWGEELPSKVRMMATVTLEPGVSVGVHAHNGESETYRIREGRGLYNDNGTEIEVGPGEVTICPSGQVHGLANTGKDNLIFDAVIVKD